MKYFLDTEFIENGKTIDLISIGIISEDNREYYAISSEFNIHKANDWVKENVISKLESIERKNKLTIKEEIIAFIGNDDKPEFWGYYADYDWVVFCWLFGSMMNLPKNFPMYCRDIKQLIDEKGNPKIPINHANEHNALWDAKWNKSVYEWINKNE